MSRPSPRGIWVGSAGWSYPDWKGTVYPAAPARGFEPLTFLSSYLDLVEINTSYYRIPSPAHGARWLQLVGDNPRFRFTLKLFRGYTHEPELPDFAEDEAWEDALEPLRSSGRLGAVLAQFPYTFRFEHTSSRRLEEIRRRFPADPLVAEFRHDSWLEPSALQLLEDLGISFCNIDQPRVSRSLGPTALTSGPIGYVRLHGRNVRDWFRAGAGRDQRYNYLYNEPELRDWEGRIGRLADELEAVYVVTNNHYRGQAVCNALQLRSDLERRRIAVPPLLGEAFPQLKRIAQ